MSRAQVLAAMRVAGYHNDTRSFCRLYTENRISRAAADKEWQAGVSQKKGGMKCSCPSCNTPAPATSSVSCHHGLGLNCLKCYPVQYGRTNARMP